MVISMLKIRRPLGRLIFNMGIAIPGKTVFLIETAPRPPMAGPVPQMSGKQSWFGYHQIGAYSFEICFIIDQ